MRYLTILFALLLSTYCQIACAAKPLPSTDVALIRSGAFVMGSPSNELGRFDQEPQHRVTLTKDFYLMKFEVTQGEYQALMGENPSGNTACGSTCPVENVTWDDAVAYANALSDKEGFSRCYSGKGAATRWDKSCTGYRLPTEAEWEYAARAGTTTALYNGNLTTISGPDKNADAIAWHMDNSGGTTHPVGRKKPNAWGLYDTSGNVIEWMWDKFREGDEASNGGRAALIDPTGPTSGNGRVIRGGCYAMATQFLRVSARSYAPETLRKEMIGFRLARTVQ